MFLSKHDLFYSWNERGILILNHLFKEHNLLQIVLNNGGWNFVLIVTNE